MLTSKSAVAAQITLTVASVKEDQQQSASVKPEPPQTSIPVPPTITITPHVNVVQEPTQNTNTTDCSEMIEISPHHEPSLGIEWTLEAIGEDRVVHIWSNHWETNLPEFKFFLPAGQSVSFMSGGGTEWRAQPGCTAIAKIVFQRDSMPEISTEQYQAYIVNRTIP